MKNVILINQIRRLHDERVIIISKLKTDGNRFAVISLDDPKAWPVIYSASALKDCELIEDDSSTKALNSESKQFTKAQDRLKVIKPILDLMDWAFDKTERGKAIRDVCKNNDISQNTVRDSLRRYWQSGCSLTGLIQVTVNSRIKKNGQKPRGAKPRLGKTFLMTSEVENEVKTHICQAIFGRKLGVAAAYRNFIAEHFPHHTAEAQLKGEIPNERQYRYIYNSRFSKEERLKRVLGFKTMQLSHKTKYGNAKDSVSSALEVYEIDSTPGETEIASRFDRTLPVGKPTVYYIKDRGTSLIAGFYISFDSPSWAVAKEAIMSLACCKKTLCNKYGVEYDPKDWPADCLLPSEFIGDLGPEMTSSDSDAVTDILGCTFTNTSRQDGPAKGTVESAFNSSQQRVEAGLPGHRKDKNRGERQKGKADKEAALNIDEYTTLILQNVIHRNRSVLSATKPIIRFVEAKVPYVPVEMFNHDLLNMLGFGRQTTLKELQTKLMPRTIAKNTSNGLNLKGVFYKPMNSDGISDKLTQHRHQTGAADVTVLYDSNNIDTVWALLDGPDGPLTELKTCGGFEHFKSFSFREIKIILEDNKALNQSKIAEKRNDEYDLEKLKAAITAKAILEKKVHAKESPRASKQTKTDARNAESREQRSEAHSAAPIGNYSESVGFVMAITSTEPLDSKIDTTKKTEIVVQPSTNEFDYSSWE
jgi:putative transposase